MSTNDQSFPTVDVVIPARNEARLLGECLDSLAAQSYPAELVRVIVVDDGSTDTTAEIARSKGATVVHGEKRGAGAARNAGMAQGNGELVAFLDAHCTADPEWLRLLAERFSSPGIGGCQAAIEHRASNRKIQRYIETSGAFTAERIVEATISGRKHLFPWILSGCSMYRRSAVEQAGGFNETLPACEDVDLSWRVLLLGYELTHEPKAACIHIDGNSWHRFLQKNYSYGKGAALLAHMYRAHGASEKYRSSRLWTLSLERFLAAAYYDAGFRSQRLRFRLGLDHATRVAVQQTAEQFRPAFAWTEGLALQISRDAVYWSYGELETAIVHIPTHRRLVMEGIAGFIWRRLAGGASREQIIAGMMQIYSIDQATAAQDLDDFVSDATEAGVLIRHPAVARILALTP
ncbi:MAG TPA: PqqD family peptide modification chaperone [Terriglobales bacterium]|nr:PqqD family peptide modification chaperone [Terriglobales bacterium]